MQFDQYNLSVIRKALYIYIILNIFLYDNNFNIKK